jgi:cellobiose-specific phosphotransferase system component IIB
LSAQAGAKRLEFEIVVVLEGSILFKKEREASAEKKFLGQRSFVHLLMFGGWARRKRKTYSKPSTAVAFAERKYQDKKKQNNVFLIAPEQKKSLQTNCAKKNMVCNILPHPKKNSIKIQKNP